MINMMSQLVPQQGAGANASFMASQKLPGTEIAGNKPQQQVLPEVQGGMDAQSVDELTGMVNQLNEYMEEAHRGLRFSVDDDSGRTVVRVIDTETDEVVRQIPSEEMLVLIRHFNETSGKIIDEVV